MYVDSSALLKLYFDEPEREECRRLLEADPHHATARVTLVEVRRNLARRLEGDALARAEASFRRDWDGVEVVEVDEELSDRAAEIAEQTGLRTLDALHLGAAERAGGELLTYDARQARVARELGWTVWGA